MPVSPTRATALALALLLATSSPAQPLPDLGDSSARVLSPQNERALGHQTMARLRASGALLDDPEVNAYLQSLGQRLVSADPAIGALSFEFFALPDSQINAFALPGGHIGVNSGLILAARSESELASVLAHEISHVSQRHIARQLEAQAGNQLAMMAAMIGGLLAAGSGNSQVASAAIAGATAGHAQSQLDYSRAHEREADRLGFELLVRAGFDGAAMSSFFTRLQQLTRVYDGSTPGYLRSHPLTHERIAEAQDRALAGRYRQVADSLDFLLVQGLLQSYQGEAGEAVARLQSQLAAQDDSPRRDATRYGLAAALLRNQAYDAALAEIAGLERGGLRHPMVDALAGQILQQAGRNDAALARYREALERYPEHTQLVQDYPRALLAAGRAGEAADFARVRLASRRDSRELHLVAAEAHARLGRELASHYHQGEAYALMGRLPAALEQMQIALRSRGDDDQLRQIAETRVRELRERIRADAEERRRNGGSESASGPELLTDDLPRFTLR